MPEFSKPYSKAIAFNDGTYPPDMEFRTKLIRTGETNNWYDPVIEDEHSALPKKDIEELIKGNLDGLTVEFTVMTDVTVLNGLVKKRIRTLTFENGLLVKLSTESIWS